jgi:hypothetical protein
MNPVAPTAAASLSWSGLVGATVTVLVTTVDDSVWLIRFVGTSKLSSGSKIVNSVVFLSTLLCLAVGCCLLAMTIEWAADDTKKKNTDPDDIDDDEEETQQEQQQQEEQLEIRLELIAVVICWALAIGFYVKKQLKIRRKRRMKQQQQQQQPQERERNALLPTSSSSSSNNKQDHDSESNVLEAVTENYGTSISKDDPASQLDRQRQQDVTSTTSSTLGSSSTSSPMFTGPSPLTVMSLTCVGFLDEVSYFPTLILGKILTPVELVIGTILAGIIMLCIQIFVAQTVVRPVIDWIDDHVQLYHIIGVFATLLTIQLLWDLHSV